MVFIECRKRNRLVVPVVTGCETYIVGKMKKVPHAEEAFGYTFEKVVLYATSLGIGTTWIAGTMERKGFEEAIDLKEDEVMPCVSPLGYPAKKMSFRETMMRKGIRADSRLPFEEFFYENDFMHAYGKENSELNRLLDMCVSRRPPSTSSPGASSQKTATPISMRRKTRVILQRIIGISRKSIWA